MKNNILILAAVFLFPLFVVSCQKEKAWDVESTLLRQYIEENNITTTPTSSGLYYIETKRGSGANANGGDEVKVKYKGTLLNGEEFDSGTFSFPLGYGYVIRGWDEGISYMKEGGTAILIIPSSLAYGAQGSGKIEPYTTLIFEVELLDVI